MMRRSLCFLWNRFEITRPHNLLVAALTFLVGWALAGAESPGLEVALAALAGTLVAAAGNVVNDYFDSEIDRINKPRRPIPSGRITRRESYRFACLLALAALVVAGFSGWAAFVCVSVWCVCLYVYSARLKTRLLLGNLMVSAVSSSGFVLGAWLAGRVAAAFAPARLGLLFMMGREIVKDVEDLPGDEACGARTLPGRLGERRALAVALGFFALFAALVPWPYHLQIFGPPYLWTYMLGVVPLLAFAVLLMLRDTSPANLWRVSWILKLDMLLGVVGFWLGRGR